MRDLKIAVITVTYGNRWGYLSKVVDTTASNPLISQVIIVDNASDEKQGLVDAIKIYKDKLHIIRHTENLGSAGGYASGLSYAREHDFDFVLLLDDDNLPEEKAIEKYLAAYDDHGGGKVIIGGNRVDLKGSQEMFEGSPKSADRSHTFFSVFSFAKVGRFLSFFSRRHKEKLRIQQKSASTIEIFAFGYGGAFLPKQAIMEAPLPTTDLFTYGDDMEYSWGLLKLGYRCFLEKNIAIKDIDLTFSQEDQTSHLIDLFLPNTPDSKVFYRMRNAAYISKKHTSQSNFVLAISICIWYCGLLTLFIIKKKHFGKFQLRRAKLIGKALYLGYVGQLKRFI